MKLNKAFWSWFLTITLSVMAVNVIYDYLFPGKDGFNPLEVLKSGAFVGAFTAIMMYFNRHTLKAEPRGNN